MKPYLANLLTAVVAIAMSLWAYLGSDDPSMTALIPAAFGLIFLALAPAFKKENRIVVHVIVVLTLLLFIALFRPLSGVLAKQDTIGILRVGLMMVVAFVAMVVYVKSFIDARKKRSQT
ncbi:MAG: hypothetical protein OEQ53_04410 [Saprospiraceae bacterium]|nr:hypothetical protein [Saprospiraceae bacterium]